MRNILLVAAIVLGAAVVFACRLVLLAVGSLLYVYLLPGVVAQKRQHPRRREIYIVSALAGWLVLPWIAALAYAARGEMHGMVCGDLPLVAGALDD